MQKTFLSFPEVVAGFTDKSDGNLSFVAGSDSKEMVAKNRKRLLKIGSGRGLSWVKQIHSTKIKIATKEGEAGVGDGILTDQPGLMLMVLVADCVPVLLYDPVRKIIGAVHSGRRGTLAGIVPQAIEMMQKQFGSAAEDIQVSCGPAIQKCCYYFEGENLNLPGIIKEQLLAVGVPESNLQISSTCTKCDYNYFSYRRHSQTGRFAGIISLR